MVLASSVSWSLHWNWAFSFTATYGSFSGLPLGDSDSDKCCLSQFLLITTSILHLHLHFLMPSKPVFHGGCSLHFAAGFSYTQVSLDHSFISFLCWPWGNTLLLSSCCTGFSMPDLDVYHNCIFSTSLNAILYWTFICQTKQFIIFKFHLGSQAENLSLGRKKKSKSCAKYQTNDSCPVPDRVLVPLWNLVS